MAYTSAELAEIRRKARTDLYYLATEILGYDLVPDVHQPLCDVFIKKDPDKDLFDQDEIRSRLILDPRGHFKTTIDICDAIQWIINFPNIRILFVSGTQLLAQRMLQECRYHFLGNEKFREVFFEYAMDEDDSGNTFEFTVPARTNKRLREPTVSISTINSVKAGSHYDVIKFDDVVDEQNSQNAEQLEKTINGFNSTVPLLEPDGYRDVIGTRYDHSDLYGWIIDKNKEDGDWKTHVRTACSLPFNKNSEILFKQDGKGKKRFDYNVLKKILRDDPRLFGCQYLNDPSYGESSNFPEDLLRKCLIDYRDIPLMMEDSMSGRLAVLSTGYMGWDLAFSTKKTGKFTCGMFGVWDTKGRLFIVDGVHGRFSSDELIYKYLYLANKWKLLLNRSAIEEAAGSALMGPGLRMMAEMKGINLPPIDWVPTGNTNKAKEEKVFALLPLLKANRLFFNKDLPFIDTLIKEFAQFPRYKYNDICDATALLLKYQPIIEPKQTVPTHPFVASMFSRNELTPANPIGSGLVG